MKTTKDPVFHDLYYGQTFIDSDVLALVYELTGPDNELVEWGIAPYNWMLT